MKDKTFCEICSIEVNLALVYKHISSKEHKENESYLVKKGMTYCGVCKKEIRNDEWREHSISKYHLEIEKLDDCIVCKEKDTVYGDQYISYQDKCRYARENPNRGTSHKKSQEFFDLQFS